MENKDEQTLAKTVAELNEKIEILTNNQKELEKNYKVIMQRISKLQEYNEIDDMRNKIVNEQLNIILKKIVEIEDKLY